MHLQDVKLYVFTNFGWHAEEFYHCHLADFGTQTKNGCPSLI